MANDTRKQPIYLGYTGDPETFAVDAPHPYPGQVGTRHTVQQPGPRGVGSSNASEDYRSKTYQLVQGDSSMSTAPFPGAVMWWANKATYKVTTSPTSTARGNIAGVVGNASPGKGQYFFIQVEGPATVKMKDGTALATVAGDSIIPSDTAGKADRVAAGTAPTYPTLGLAAAAANAALSEVLVDLAVPQTP
jgi:hypothetical protein